MTTLEQLFIDLLAGETKGRSHRQVIENLLTRGLLNVTACERISIRHHVEILERQGMRRGQAMEDTAEQHCCSYEKVRSIIYAK
ncbi:MAG: hypothetical protein RR330_03125 [Alistipes sp.]